MKSFVKPRIIISKCIEFDFCRYNKQIIQSQIVNKLKPHIEFLPICPEVEIGLGVPRDPIRIIEKQKEKYLLQPSTNRDISQKMSSFAQHFLTSQKDIDGFLLKSQSPSCGTRDAKIYTDTKQSAVIGRGAGFFGKYVLSHFPFLAVEDEMRLQNPSIRKHYYTKIFTFARFRKIKEAKMLHELLKFHTENKFLLMGYSQKELRILGNILANQEKQPTSKVFLEYEQHLHIAFSKAPRYTSEINVLEHVFGYLSEALSEKEKKFYIDLIEKFRNGHIPLSVPINLIRSWVIRFEQAYLFPQTLFQPYPDELLDVEAINAHELRDYWK